MIKYNCKKKNNKTQKKTKKKVLGCMKGSVVYLTDIILPVCNETDWNVLK